MINIAVILDDKEIYRCIFNNLLLNNSLFRICCVVNNSEELFKIIKNYKIDIIFMDIYIWNNDKMLRNSRIFRNYFYKSIILIGDSKKNFYNEFEKNFICGYVNSNDQIKKVVEEINVLIYSKQMLEIKSNDRNKEKAMKEKIKKELLELGYNLLLIGSKYLLETIYILYTLDNYLSDNLEKDIYPIIAKKYGKTINNIKCNIRYATENMYYENDERKIRSYLKNESNKIPRIKEVIAVILNKIT